MGIHLSPMDVEQLAYAASPHTRADVAGKVAQSYADGTLGGREKDLAIEIFRMLVRDVEVKVREALSHHLKTATDLPYDIVLRLAHDVGQVSAPMLEFSALLDDEALVEIVESSHELVKLLAVAKREVVHEEVSDALLASMQDHVARTLFLNRGALIREETLLWVIEQMSSHESVVDALMQRGGLSVTCVEKIFLTVSDYMKKQLIEKYNISRHLVEGRIEYAREWATLGMAQRSSVENVEALVRHLHEQHKLTSSIVIRSLCVGDLRFFEYAMACLTGVPVDNACLLIRDAGDLGFRSLYRQTPLPPVYYGAVSKVLEITLDVSRNGRDFPNDFCRQVVDNIISRGYDQTVEYMPLLLAIIKGNASEPSRIH